MFHWINFVSFIFWVSLSLFSLNLVNILITMVLAEICWLFLYLYTALVGCLNDDINTITFSFFILGLASVEFGIIYVISVLMKNFNKSVDLYKNDLELKKYFLKKSSKIVFLKS